MTTQNLPMPDSDVRPSLWRRRNLLIGLAGAVAVPLAGAAIFQILDPTPHFWHAAWNMLQAELAAVFGLFGVGQIIPKLRQRLELPAPEGDERERLIVMKSSHFTSIVAQQGLLVTWLGMLVCDALKQPLTVTTDGMLTAVIVFGFAQFASTVYYSRRM